jgi:hypothetical protein
MNERIKELAIEARLIAPEYSDCTHTTLSPQEQKFAELIVKECAQVCNNIDAEYEGEDVLATWCATAIREHFGVEE